MKDATWIRAEASPVAAADRLFPKTTGTMASDAEFRKLALGLTERELEALSGSVKNLSREQSKLSVHLEAVRALKAGGQSGNMCMGQPSLPTVEALRSSGANVTDAMNLPQVLRRSHSLRNYTSVPVRDTGRLHSVHSPVYIQLASHLCSILRD